jgi:hypothetical protein
MNDHMQSMAGCMAMMPDAMDMHEKTGATMNNDKGMMGDQK